MTCDVGDSGDPSPPPWVSHRIPGHPTTACTWTGSSGGISGCAGLRARLPIQARGPRQAGGGEAEWLLDVLEGLFDFYFVQPALLKAKRDALNKKLKDAGKPAMK
jgi:hypothetical protein